MKKGYQSVQMRVWRYSEDIVRTSNPEPAWSGDVDSTYSNSVTTDVMDN